MKRKVAAVILVGAPMLLFSAWVLQNRYHRREARKAWKDAAVMRIAQLADDAAWRATQTGAAGQGWATGQMIVMQNGDWIVCDGQYHEQEIDDIFIGKASDGKWYFSTFHFCKNNIVLKIEAQAVDLDAFKTKYALREFDGQSDEALKKTWPTQE